MYQEPSERIRSHYLNIRFKCEHCDKELKICWTCGGNGYYYSDRDGVKRQRYDCSDCNSRGLKHE